MSQIKTGAKLSYINIIVNTVITFLYTPFLISMIGQKEYGLYSLVASVIAYLSVLDMGFGNAMIRFVAKHQAHNDNQKIKQINGTFLLLYTAVGVLSLIIGATLFANINNLFGSSLDAGELAKARIIMCILIGTVSLSFPLSIFASYAMASERFVFLKILDILKHMAIPATMIPVLFLGGKSISIVVVTGVFTLAYSITVMLYCLKKLKMQVSFNVKNLDKQLLRSITAYSFWVFLNIIIDNLYNNTDQVILGSVKGTSAVAVYAIASKIYSTNQTFSTSISGLFLPKVAKTLEMKDGDKKVSDIFIQVSRLQLYIMTLILTAFIVFGRSFIRLWVGDDYSDAYYILILLMGPSIIPLTQNICISIVQAKNKHQFRSIVYIIIALINIAASIPLAIQFGGIGAAIGTACAEILGQFLIMNWFYWKKAGIDIPRYWKNFIKFSLPVAALAIAAFFITKDISFSWVNLMLAIGIYSIAYLAIVLLYSNKYERNLYRSLLRFKK